MAANPSHPKVIADCLRRLRRRIRQYVWLEGLAMLLAWIGAAYWIGLAFDYLPVLAGSPEMPRLARIVWLGITIVGACWIAYRWILRRAFAKLSDPSLALLIERRFPELDDALLTAVETSSDDLGTDAQLRSAMLRQATEKAAGTLPQLPIAAVLNGGPLRRRGLVAGISVASIAAFALLAFSSWSTWTSRFLLLSDAPWPRHTTIEVLDFPDGRRTTAEGSDVVIRVRADQRRRVPEVCRIEFVSENGQTGRVNMSRDGEPREGFQYYRYQGTPFQGMLDSVDFDVVGLDHRVSGYRVNVVASPSVVNVRLDCVFPEYMQTLARRETWAPGIQLPTGTSLQLVGRSTKPLREVRIQDGDEATPHLIQLDTKLSPAERTEFQFDLGMLESSRSLKIELLDDDRVTSDKPYNVTLTAVEDTPPNVQMELEGIGTAITPEAKLPMQGKIDDDYGVERSWFQIAVSDREVPVQVGLEERLEGEFEASLDLREQRAKEDAAWETRPGAKIVLDVRAIDYFDLEDEPHVGFSEPYPLDVVTPNELLALLEARELGLKERFEHVITELAETRDALARLQGELIKSRESSNGSRSSSGEPSVSESETDANAGPPVDSGAGDEARQITIWRLRTQRAEQQSSKSQQEVAGVGEAFVDIRAQLINNRVDTPERNQRIEEKIILPIENVVGGSFVNLVTQLSLLDQQLEQPLEAESLAEGSVLAANEVIVELQQILQNMLELETYNELVDLVRSIIDQQEQLRKNTEAKRKEQARGLLED